MYIWKVRFWNYVGPVSYLVTYLNSLNNSGIGLLSEDFCEVEWKSTVSDEVFQ